MLDEARQFDRLGRSRAIDNRVASEWSQIQRELNIISDAYGLGYGYTNGGYYPNGRNYPNNQNRNNEWWRRIPWPN